MTRKQQYELLMLHLEERSRRILENFLKRSRKEEKPIIMDILRLALVGAEEIERAHMEGLSWNEQYETWKKLEAEGREQETMADYHRQKEAELAGIPEQGRPIQEVEDDLVDHRNLVF